MPRTPKTAAPKNTQPKNTQPANTQPTNTQATNTHPPTAETTPAMTTREEGTVPKARTSSSPVPVPREELDRLVGGAHHNPHGILGVHVHNDTVTIRTLRPMAEKVVAVIGDTRLELAHEHGGVFTG